MANTIDIELHVKTNTNNTSDVRIVLETNVLTQQIKKYIQIDDDEVFVEFSNEQNKKKILEIIRKLIEKELDDK